MNIASFAVFNAFNVDSTALWNPIREGAAMKRSVTVTSILSILAMFLCLAMTPLTASAAAAESPYGGLKPIFFGGELHGTKASSVEVEGQGTLSATMN